MKPEKFEGTIKAKNFIKSRSCSSLATVASVRNAPKNHVHKNLNRQSSSTSLHQELIPKDASK